MTPLKLRRFSGLIIAIVLILFSFCTFRVAAAELRGKEEKTFTFTVNGKIVKTGSLEQDGKYLIRVDHVTDVFESCGAHSEFDSESRVLTIDYKGSTGKPSNLQLPGKTPLVVVLNGKIYKTALIQKDKCFYLPLSTVVLLLKNFGFDVEIDREIRVASMVKGGQTGGNSSEKTPSEKESGPFSTPTPGHGTEREKIAEYMNSLKKIFNENMPPADEVLKIQASIQKIGRDSIKTSDIDRLKRKYADILRKIRKLHPPDRSTAEVHRLALNVFINMVKIMELSKEILETPKGYENRGAVEKLQFINQRIKQDSTEFDRRVRKIREKYNLGPP